MHPKRCQVLSMCYVRAMPSGNRERRQRRTKWWTTTATDMHIFFLRIYFIKWLWKLVYLYFVLCVVCRKLICVEVECWKQRGKLQKSENCKNCKALGSLLKMRYICLPAAANNVVSTREKKREDEWAKRIKCVPSRRRGICIMFLKNSITHDEGANLFSFERRSVVIALMLERWQFSIFCVQIQPMRRHTLNNNIRIICASSKWVLSQARGIEKERGRESESERKLKREETRRKEKTEKFLVSLLFPWFLNWTQLFWVSLHLIKLDFYALALACPFINEWVIHLQFQSREKEKNVSDEARAS